MSEIYWQAKIWGLLHDPALEALHNNSGRGENSFWQDLAVMQDWRENSWNPEKSSGKIWQHIHLADYIASASDASRREDLEHTRKDLAAIALRMGSNRSP